MYKTVIVERLHLPQAKKEQVTGDFFKDLNKRTIDINNDNDNIRIKII